MHACFCAIDLVQIVVAFVQIARPPGTRPATFSRSAFTYTIWWSRCHSLGKKFFRRLAWNRTGQSMKRFWSARV